MTRNIKHALSLALVAVLLISGPAWSAPSTGPGGGGAFDSTTVDATTWSDGANASNVWTFSVSGTNHTMTAASASMNFSHAVDIAGLLSVQAIGGVLEANLLDKSNSETIGGATWDFQAITASSVTVDDRTVEPGNLFTVNHNNTAFTLDPTCANSGTIGKLTLIDVDESASVEDHQFCNDKDIWADIVQTAADIIADTQILVGSGAGTGAYVPLSGDATLANTGDMTIGNDKILEVMLKAVNGPTDEFVLTYEATTGDFEWEADQIGGGAVAGFTFEECFVIYAPNAEVQATDSIESVWRASAALTITEVWCETDTGTVDVDLQIDDDTPADVMGTDLVCASTAVSDSTSLTGGMADGDRLDLAIGAAATNPLRLSVCIEYDYD